MPITRKLQGNIEDSDIREVSFLFRDGEPVEMVVHYLVNTSRATISASVDGPPEVATAKKVLRAAKRELQKKID